MTEETHKFLGGDYEVEDRKNIQSGDEHPYLKEKKIQSYLVIPPDNFHEVMYIYSEKATKFFQNLHYR